MEHWSCAAIAVPFNFVAYTDQLLHHGQCSCGVKYRLMKLADYLMVGFTGKVFFAFADVSRKHRNANFCNF